MSFFDFFKNQSPKNEISIPDDDKIWIEEHFIWLGELFGFDQIKENKLYNIDSFLSNKNQLEFERTFRTICEVYGINADDITIRIFDDLESNNWQTLPLGVTSSNAGEYSHTFVDRKKQFNIKLTKSTMQHPERLVGVLAHELAHVKLLGGNLIDPNYPNMEPLTDLFVIFFGFGIFTANIALRYSNHQMNKIGYLTNECIAYALALRTWITQDNKTEISYHLESNTKNLYKEYLKYIFHTKDVILTQEKIQLIELKNASVKQAEKGFNSEDYRAVIEANNELIKLGDKSAGVYNERGYAYMMLGDYEMALKDFNAGIQADHFFDSLFSNRGLCYLKMKNYDQALIDLDSAYQMNPQNQWTLRSLGMYYLETKSLGQAEVFLSEANAIDPSVQFMSYSWGKFYLANGDKDKAIEHFEESAALGQKEGIEALKTLNA